MKWTLIDKKTNKIHNEITLKDFSVMDRIRIAISVLRDKEFVTSGNMIQDEDIKDIKI